MNQLVPIRGAAAPVPALIAAAWRRGARQHQRDPEGLRVGCEIRPM